jgi:hypothetical protein
MFLMATGFLEIIGIAVGLGVLVIGTLSLVGVSLYKRFFSHRKED